MGKGVCDWCEYSLCVPVVALKPWIIGAIDDKFVGRRIACGERKVVAVPYSFNVGAIFFPVAIPGTMGAIGVIVVVRVPVTTLAARTQPEIHGVLS